MDFCISADAALPASAIKPAKSNAFLTDKFASVFKAVTITEPSSPTPLKQASSKTVVFQNKLQKHSVITPSIQLLRAPRIGPIGQTHRAAAIGPMHHR
jgi:hypothetical protein